MIAIAERPSVARLFAVPLAVAAALVALVVYLHVTPGRRLDPEVLSSQFVVSRTVRHIELVAISFAIAAIVGLITGMLLAGRGRVAELIAFIPATLGQAIPSVGVLALASQITGLGVVTTVQALAFYGLLPVLRNTVAALQGVDPAPVDAARGMGMTSLQVLVRVKLPLASPGIFAGLRTSLVLIVGTATLGNFVGGGGLGDVISAGLGNLSVHVIMAGATLVAALALLLDWILALVETLVTPHT